MPAPLLPIIIAALGGLGSSAMAVGAARRNTDRTIAANRQMAEYAYSQDKQMSDLAYRRDIEMWERQNLYNSPEAQMARLRSAGLNPNMVYGSGSVAGMQSGSPPSYNPPAFKAPDIQYRNQALQIPEVIGQYQDFQMQKAQIDNVKAQTENIHARTINESFRKILLEFGAKTSEFEFGRKQDLAPFQQEIMEKQAEKSGVDVATAIQALRNMSQEELQRKLDIRYKEKGLDIQAVDLERKQADLLFQRFRNDWMKAGITGSDNMILRVLVRMLNEAGINFDTPFPKPAYKE